MFYHAASNQYINEGMAFEIDGIQYPQNWLNLTSAEEKTTAGMVEVVTSGLRQDDRFYWVSESKSGNVITITSTPKDLDGLKAQWIKQINQNLTVPPSRAINAGTGLTGGGTLSHDITIAVANGGIGDVQLDTTGVAAGTYGAGGSVPVITVNAKGRVTNISTTSLVVTGYVPDSRQIITGSGIIGGGNLAQNLTLSATQKASLLAPKSTMYQRRPAGWSTHYSRLVRLLSMQRVSSKSLHAILRLQLNRRAKSWLMMQLALQPTVPPSEATPRRCTATKQPMLSRMSTQRVTSTRWPTRSKWATLSTA